MNQQLQSSGWFANFRGRIRKVRVALMCLLVFGFYLQGIWATQEDVEASQDHPLLSRFPGSTIVQYDHKEFDEAFWFTAEQIRVEGKVTRIAYMIPREHSTLEVFRSYEKALKKGGFDLTFSCQDKECKGVRSYLRLPTGKSIGGGESFFDEGRRSLVAQRDGNFVFVLVYDGQIRVANKKERRVVTRVRIIEGEPLDEDLIRVDASAISEQLASNGSIALYGIFFDVDQAVIKPESEGALTEIARYLTSDPDASLFVVGHTDNTGDLSHNLDLSRRRAEAVVQSLTTQHAIPPERLQADGVGPLAPVTSNDTEEGRAQNRRVQLVAQ